MNLLEYLAVGLFYIPFLAIPFVILFWYALVANRRTEQDQPEQPVADEPAESREV